MRRPFRTAFAVAFVALLTTILMFVRGPSQTSEQILDEARLHLARGDHARAEELAQRASASSQPSPWALLVAAEAALKTNRYRDALAYYERVPRKSAGVAASADFGAAEMLCHLGRISESEAQLRRLLARDPQHNLAHYRLAFLLNITGRRWEAQPHLMSLVRSGTATEEHLLLLGNSQRMIESAALLQATAVVAPDDPLPDLGAARIALTLNRRDEAKRLLEKVLSKLPHETEAVVRWGQVLLEESDTDQFVRWSTSLTNDVERHPDVWMLRGQFALSRSQFPIAARCFWESLRRDSNHLAACHQLGRVLIDLNDTDHATVFLSRAELLQQLSVVLDDLFHHRDHIESMQRASILLRELGRLWEAIGWSAIALAYSPNLEWARQTISELGPLLRPESPQTLVAYNPADIFDLSPLPRPDWTSAGQPEKVGPPSTSTVSSEIQFIDVAQSAGVDFRYENAADISTPGARIFETTGGGVGVIDYDIDGWPDLYFTQGGTEPRFGTNHHSDQELTANAIDRLFRNQSNGRFADCTHSAGLGDPDFSQGISVGDFDNDGFPDLYVANLGRNRLYRNQGDGTFSDVTECAGIYGQLWTTSCLIADLDADGMPDLYDVGYATGDAIFSRICEKQGVMRSCSPRAFDPASDRLWLNQGDGRFRDASAECGVDIPSGYGLGIVAADFDESGHISLFVANDEVPNFLFVHDSASTIGAPRFRERGMTAGVAVDADGMSQACMGIAAGDANGDGRLDLYVTNFYLESNTLYRQIAPGQFADVTRSSLLRDPSFAMLGFGTQFLDADLDGLEDLVVTNGHIDDLASIGEPYRMRAQIYRNLGRGRFAEIPVRNLGEYFEQKHLGRGLARLDWNRDGREEFAISQIGEPASVMQNTSRSTGRYLAIQLKGRSCSRDAIGATVRVTVGGLQLVKQLTAGDGYQASNERQLVFGVEKATSIDEVQVRWPNGGIQTWNNLPADQTVLVIERNEIVVRLVK